MQTRGKCFVDIFQCLAEIRIQKEYLSNIFYSFVNRLHQACTIYSPHELFMGLARSFYYKKMLQKPDLG